jgi:hypothetical protein
MLFSQLFLSKTTLSFDLISLLITIPQRIELYFQNSINFDKRHRKGGVEVGEQTVKKQYIYI